MVSIDDFFNTGTTVATATKGISIDDFFKVETQELIKPKSFGVTGSFEESKPERLAKSFGGGLLGTVTDTASALEAQGVERPLLEKGLSPMRSDLVGLGAIDKISKVAGEAINKLFKPAKEKLEIENPTFVEKLVGGGGSLAGFYLSGLGVLKGSKALNASAKVATVLGTGVASLLESAQEAGGVFEELKQQGKTEQEAKKKADEVFFRNLPLNFILDNFLFGKLAEGKPIKELFKGASQEASQEGIQQIISNVATDKPVLQGVPESMAIGGILGGGVSGARALLGKPTQVQETIKEQPQEKKAEDFARKELRDGVPLSAVKNIDDEFILSTEKNTDISFDNTGRFFEDVEKSKKQIDENVKQLQEGKELPPILVNEKGDVIDGQHRMAAYEALGITDIPVYKPKNKEFAPDNLRTRKARLGQETELSPEFVPEQLIEPTVEQAIPQEVYEQNREVKQQSQLRQDAGNMATNIFEPISSTLRKINPKLSDAIRKFEFNIANNTKKDFSAVEPYLNKARKMDAKEYSDLDLALKNGDRAKVDQLNEKYGLTKEFEATREKLDDIFKRANEVGMDVNFLADYFPRKIKDYTGFLNAIKETEQWSAIDEAIKLEEKERGIMSDEERATMANMLLRGFPQKKVLLSKPGAAKERSIQTVTPELNKFYKDSSQAAVEYIDNMNNAIEARKIFGKNKEKVDESIGWYVNELVKKGEISSKDEQKVRDIFTARMNPKGPGATVRFFKNMAYMYTLNNPGNAITQVGDLAWSIYKNGYYGTAKSLLSKKDITKEDLGIDAISEEFRGDSKSGKAVNTLFKLIGLEKIDRIGKETFINAGLNRMSNEAKKNDPNLDAELQRVFGENAEQVKDDLKRKDVTDEVRYLLFAELADFQPIAMSEMPKAYVQGGNARIWYMLKSFTLKQIDITRREIFETIKTDPKKGMKNLIKLSSAYVLMGASADMLKSLLFNRPIDISDLVMDNLLKLMAFSKWQIYQAKKDGLMKTAMMSILPPIPFVDDVYKDTVRSLNNGSVDVKKLKTLKGMPLVGKMYYWWFGGGKDISQKRQAKKKRLLRTKQRR